MLHVAAEHLRSSPAGKLLLRVFRVLNDAKVRYCITHGYANYPHRVDSDVDCLMDASWLPARLSRLLHEHQEDLGAQVVQWFEGQSHFVVLAGTDPASGELFFLHLHVSADIDIAHRQLYAGREVLRHRQRHGDFWIPSPRHEFAGTLVRRIEKFRFTDDHVRHLRQLERCDPAGCAAEVTRWFGDVTDVWKEIDANLPAMRRQLLRRAAMSNVRVTMSNAMLGAMRIIQRAWRANRGLNIVILGPDGSGKSSIVESIRQDWAGAFVGSQRRTFPPALLNRKAANSSTTPHAVKPRSWLASVARAIGYWMVYYTIGHYFTVHRAKARGKLIIHDRHLFDCLVDPKRYRYAGPMRLLRAIARIIHKPDMVLLLDAPAKVIQRRKQEVAPEETERQLREYRKLARRLSNASVIGVDRPLSEVVEIINQHVGRCLRGRVVNRFGLMHADVAGLRQLLDIHGPEARVASSSRAASHRYAILPSRSTARWFIPLDNPAVAAAGLSLAMPTKRAARCVHAGIRALARTGTRLWYRDAIHIEPSGAGEIEAVMQRLFPHREIRLAISLGSPPPALNRKISLAVLDRDGKILAFAKLPGSSNASKRSVRAEADALRHVQAMGLPAPRLLWSGQTACGYMTVASPLGGRPAGMQLCAAHHAFLARLRQSPIRPADRSAFADSLRDRADLLNDDRALREAPDRVRMELSGHELPSTIVHGDFAPWNLRIDTSGQIGAFDWEYMQIDGLPLIDEIHHLLAVGYLARRWPASKALNMLRHHAAARPLGYSSDLTTTLQRAYLLDYMLRLRTEGCSADCPRFVWCRDILMALSGEGSAP